VGAPVNAPALQQGKVQVNPDDLCIAQGLLDSNRLLAQAHPNIQHGLESITRPLQWLQPDLLVELNQIVGSEDKGKLVIREPSPFVAESFLYRFLARARYALRHRIARKRAHLPRVLFGESPMNPRWEGQHHRDVLQDRVPDAALRAGQHAFPDDSLATARAARLRSWPFHHLRAFLEK